MNWKQRMEGYTSKVTPKRVSHSEKRACMAIRLQELTLILTQMI
ncbi:hypothetical protein ES703_66283 [subsurface metagenome]